MINNKKKNLKNALFWYNVLLGISLLAVGLKIGWVLTKYNEMPLTKLIWKLAIIITTALSFFIYYWIRRRDIFNKLKEHEQV